MAITSASQAEDAGSIPVGRLFFYFSLFIFLLLTKIRHDCNIALNLDVNEEFFFVYRRLGLVNRRLSGYLKEGGPFGFLLTLSVVLVSTLALGTLAPDFFLIPFIPAIFLIAYIFITKRILESLVLASLICYIFADGLGFFSSFATGLTEVMMDEDTGWLIVVCGLMGSIIMLMEKAGGTFAFGAFVSKRCRSRKGTLVWTWLLGVIIFIDDYLNSLTVGACMSKVTDRQKCSRELLSYIVDSTAAPICAIIPISTWAVFVARILSQNGVCSPEEGILYFIRTIPFNFYAIIAAVMVLLVICEVFPLVGKLKKAEERVHNGGPLAPPHSERMGIHGDNDFIVPREPRMKNFLLPVLVLIISTVAFKVDMQKGVLCTLAFMFFFYVGQGLMSAEEFTDYCLDGIKNMLLPILLTILAFLFSKGADRIYFTESVIEAVLPYMTPELMPALVFVVLGITEFITGTSWGMYIIALPIVVPLANELGANLLISVSAVLSAGVFGSHICFYSDATIISSAACGCNNFEHAASQMPYGIISASLALVCFIVSGFVFL